MAKPTEGSQKGAQAHAEGQHGERTRQRLKEQINDEGRRDETDSQRAASDPNWPAKAAGGEARTHEAQIERGNIHGDRRLFEGREQHDEAEKNSEKTRLSRDIERHGHDREQFQVEGGAESHPKLPD